MNIKKLFKKEVLNPFLAGSAAACRVLMLLAIAHIVNIKKLFKKEVLNPFLAGSAAACLVLLPTTLAHIENNNPYDNVHVVSQEIIDYNMHFEAYFDKHDECVFVDLQIFGSSFDTWERLDWEQKDNTRGDRFEGKQYLSIVIITRKTSFDRIEIRTRHDCDGVKTDKIFAIIDVE